MRSIFLKRLRVENYKCHEVIEKKFGKKSEIYGKNGIGKSSLMDAFLDILTGKMSDGTVPDGIRIKKNGEEVSKVDVIRQIDIELDGKPVTISKVTKQKWRKPRGQSEEIFDGNATSYSIDGFDTSPKSFEEYMSKIAPSDTIYMCSNPNAFLSVLKKSTSDARIIMEKMAGFSVEEFISNNSEFADVLEITKGHSVEETLKQLKKTLTAQKKKVDAKNTEIAYEKNRKSSVGSVELSDLEISKGEWKEKLSALDKEEAELDESGKKFDEMSSGIMELKFQATEIEKVANEDVTNARIKANSEISEINMELSNLEQDKKTTLRDIDICERESKDAQSNLHRFRNLYTEKMNETFDDGQIEQVKNTEFDKNSEYCRTCGQKLPNEEIETLILRFEENKKRRYDELVQKKSDFENGKIAALKKIEEDGNRAKALFMDLGGNRNKLLEKISSIEKKIEDTKALLDRKTSAYEKLPSKVDMSGNAEYKNLLRQIAEKEFAIRSMNDISRRRQEIRSCRNQLNDNINQIERQIGKVIVEGDEKEKRIINLNSELRELSQIQADIEQKIDIVSSFSRKKNEALAEIVNKHFKEFQFEFLNWTQEGNPYETCVLVRKGIEYSNLNYSDQIICHVDLIRGFQEMSDLELPIWIDNVESVNDGRLPDVKQQLITLRVTDDTELKVNNIS